MKEGSLEFKSIEDAMSYTAILARAAAVAAATKNELPPLSLYKPKPKTIVAGGDPVLMPVDKMAARVVAPAPEHFKPPPAPATKVERHKVNKEEQESWGSDAANKELSRGGYSPSGKDFIKQKKEKDFDVELAAGMTKRFEKNVEATEDLVRRAEEATAAVKYLVDHMPIQYAAYDEFLLKALKDTRGVKAAIEIETKLVIAALADIRKFFLDPRHEEEVAKLKEFITLCERLRELKNSGFLDTIADTILRLEIGNQ